MLLLPRSLVFCCLPTAIGWGRGWLLALGVGAIGFPEVSSGMVGQPRSVRVGSRRVAHPGLDETLVLAVEVVDEEDGGRYPVGEERLLVGARGGVRRGGVRRGGVRVGVKQRLDPARGLPRPHGTLLPARPIS